MRRFLFVAMISLAACSRQVTVETAPAAAVEVSLKVTNNTAQAVTLYVTYGGTELTLTSVAARSTEIVPVRGVPAGSTVRLRATLADGSKSYTREGVVLNGVFEWQVP